MGAAKFKDLTGLIYGRLMVIERIPNIKGRVAFRCSCSCGTVKDILAGSLRSGSTTSCGCLHAEAMGKDLYGLKFGFWTVVHASSKRSANGYRYWLCRCDCGNEKEICGDNLLSNRSKACGTCAHSKKYCLRGHDTELWGRTKENSCRVCLRDRHLRVKYGISLEEFYKLYEAQDGKCAICQCHLGIYEPLESGFNKGSRIEVDHDHKIKDKRKSVRGLLCGGRWAGCNRRIGRLDKVPWLRQVITYLEHPPAQDILRMQSINRTEPNE